MPNKKSKLRELVLATLYERPICTFQQLQTQVAARGGRCTVQGLYFELRELCRQNVILKVGKNYLLDLAWLSKQQTTLANAVSRYQEELVRGTLCEFFSTNCSNLKCRTLHELHLIWSSLTYALFMRTPGHDYFEWSPYAWFALTSPAIEEQVLAQHVAHSIPYHLILGNDCLLNRIYQKKRAKIPGRTVIAKAPRVSMQRKYISVYADSIITITLDRDTNARIEQLFTKAASAAELHSDEAVKLLLSPGTITIKCEIATLKAASLMRAFKGILDL